MLFIHALEKNILDFWEQNDVFTQSLEKSKNNKPFVFFDGPPFATGMPHYGHLLISSQKDTIGRFYTMAGYFVDRNFGFDCHGLPVEFEIDKTNNLTRTEIIKMGIRKYNDLCRSIVLRYTSEWQSIIKRIGRWVSFERGYFTMEPEFMRNTWETFKKIYEQDNVYKGYRVMPYSTGCNTPLSNFEANQNYKVVEDLSVYAKLLLKKCCKCTDNVERKIDCKENCNILDKYKKLYAVIWTTTPWTLPTNQGVAVNPKFDYLIVEPLKNDEQSTESKESSSEDLNSVDKEYYIILQERVIDVFPKYRIIGKVSGKSLVGLQYDPLFDYYNYNELLKKENSTEFISNVQINNFNIQNPDFFSIVPADYVTDTSGTGLVHQSPGFGADDYDTFVKNGIINENDYMPCPIDFEGKYTSQIYDFEGKYVKHCDQPLIEKLGDKILKTSKYSHNYPMCWRSDTPLLYRLISNWFIKVKDYREKLVRINKEINWVPENIKEGKFGIWLSEAKDWSISRNRYWGTPIPIYENYNSTVYKCIGNLDELKELMITGCPKDCCDTIKFDEVDNFQLVLREFDQINEVLQNESLQNTDDVKSTGNLEKYNQLISTMTKKEQLAILDKLKPLKEHCIKNVVNDYHRENIDFINIYDSSTKSNLRRINEVFDCWFESGNMPYGTNNKKYSYLGQDRPLNECVPADFISEGVDQTRGWFYTLHVISSLLYDKPAFKNVIVNGIVLAEDGKKMSKSKKNYPDPLHVIEKYGADSVRMYMLSSPVVEAENLRFTEEGVKEIVRSICINWENCLNLCIQSMKNKKNYENSNIMDISEILGDKNYSQVLELLDYPKEVLESIHNSLDLYILKISTDLSNDVQNLMYNFRLAPVLNTFNNFMENLSNIYIRINREEIKKGHCTVLQFVLENFSKITAPFFVYFSEYSYKKLYTAKNGNEELYTSVHLEQIPNYKSINFDFSDTINTIELIRSARTQMNYPLKRCLKSVYLINKNYKKLDLNVIKKECNLLEVHNLNEDECDYDIVVKPNFSTIKNDGKKIRAINEIFNRNKVKKIKGKKGNSKKNENTEINLGEIEDKINEIPTKTVEMFKLSDDLNEETQSMSNQSKNFYLLKKLQNNETIKVKVNKNDEEETNDENLICINLDDVIYDISLKGFANKEDENIKAFTSPEGSLLLDVEYTVQIHDMQVKREFRSAMNKIRKLMKLTPEDAVEVYVSDEVKNMKNKGIEKNDIFNMIKNEHKFDVIGDTEFEGRKFDFVDNIQIVDYKMRVGIKK